MNDMQADRSFGALWFISCAIGVALLGTADLPLGARMGMVRLSWAPTSCSPGSSLPWALSCCWVADKRPWPRNSPSSHFPGSRKFRGNAALSAQADRIEAGSLF